MAETGLWPTTELCMVVSTGKAYMKESRDGLGRESFKKEPGMHTNEGLGRKRPSILKSLNGLLINHTLFSFPSMKN